MVSEAYRAQVQLLVRTIPIVAAEPCFALKGGTAINLFVRDMPRLSVDIDLTYLPIEDRPTSLRSIEAALQRIGQGIVGAIPNARITEVRTKGENALTRLLIASSGSQIKIEVTPVIRGCVYPVATRQVAPRVEATFGFAEMPVVSFADLYAGKLVAALDRQHPRDRFDVRDLLRNEGVDDTLRAAFAVYMISHDRPMVEVLSGRAKDIRVEFERGFEGMTDEPVTLADLEQAHTDLVRVIVGEMPDNHRRLLLSVEKGEPDWSLLGLDKVQNLPAVLWRLQNIRTLSAERRAANAEGLARVLGLTDAGKA
ncbi:MAG: nucleotidyl transferase AbiEii/AbiGii toxin family protein [Pseudomonadota bacterium]